MGAEQLVVRAYDRRWPLEFDRLRQRALKVLGDVPLSVGHVGSTAVPGLAGKPVIDIDVVESSPECVSVALDRLATVGCRQSQRRRGRERRRLDRDGLAT